MRRAHVGRKGKGCILLGHELCFDKDVKGSWLVCGLYRGLTVVWS